MYTCRVCERNVGSLGDRWRWANLTVCRECAREYPVSLIRAVAQATGTYWVQLRNGVTLAFEAAEITGAYVRLSGVGDVIVPAPVPEAAYTGCTVVDVRVRDIVVCGEYALDT